ncbi:hypothetical protein HDU96_001835 [Phlyctochytrium bullatum]|nr:hypothetical protein HDU96_001835 [Phlyctochytrium bullatum]
MLTLDTAVPRRHLLRFLLVVAVGALLTLTLLSSSAFPTFPRPSSTDPVSAAVAAATQNKSVVVASNNAPAAIPAPELLVDFVPLDKIAPIKCHPANNEYVNQHKDFSGYAAVDIAARRAEWRKWFHHEFPASPLATFDKANEVLVASGAPPMAGRGIVITAGGTSQRNLRLGIRALRKAGCFLPIEVWAFPGDLPSHFAKEFEGWALPNQTITFRDGVADGRSVRKMPREKDPMGYHIKISAALNNGFEEFVMLDVDVMAVKNPEMLFDSAEYREAGSVFWPDYWKTQDNNPVWKWLDTPCVDEWEQESSILVINKRRAWPALMLNWHLNRDQSIRQFHSFLWGDKDLFRFSWRASQTPFHYVQHWGVPAGFLTDEGLLPDAKESPRFCGMTVVQHGPRGDVFFLHNNLLKWADKDKFGPGDRAPILYIKRYVPRFNVSVPVWFRPEVRGAKRFEGLEPPPKGGLEGTVTPFANTLGMKAEYSFRVHQCIDIGDGCNGDKSVPSRKTELVKLESEVVDEIYRSLVARES